MPKFVKVLVVLDIIWAAIVATFGTALLVGILNYFHIGHASLAGTGLWIITFVAALFQGAVFLTLVTIFVTAIFGVSRR